MNHPTRAVVCLLLLAFHSCAFADDAPKWKAEIIDTADELKSYGLPDHIIRVTFPTYRPIEEIRNLSSYTLMKTGIDDNNIVIKGAQPLDFSTNKGSSVFITPTNGAGSTTARQVELVPAEPLDGKTTYVLQIGFTTNSPPGPLKVEPLVDTSKPETNAPGFQRIYAFTTNYLGGKFTFTLNAHATLDAQKTPAFDYKTAFDLTEFLGQTSEFHGWNPSLSLASEGTVKLKASDTNINDYLMFSANGQLLHSILTKDPFHKEGHLLYYVGFRLKGLELESDEQFKAINLTVKPQVAAWIPFSNIPALWWVHTMGINGNAATPISLFAGYSYVNALRTDPTVAIPKLQKSDRLEAELAYALPLTSKIRIGTRIRLFWLYDANSSKSYEEVFARYYLNDAKSTSVEFKYAHGEIPPSFTKGDAASAGFSLEF